MESIWKGGACFPKSTRQHWLSWEFFFFFLRSIKNQKQLLEEHLFRCLLRLNKCEYGVLACIIIWFLDVLLRFLNGLFLIFSICMPFPWLLPVYLHPYSVCRREFCVRWADGCQINLEPEL